MDTRIATRKSDRIPTAIVQNSLIRSARERQLLERRSRDLPIISKAVSKDVLQINRVSGKLVVVSSLIEWLTVVSGYFVPPRRDEGAAVHLFQTSLDSDSNHFVFFHGRLVTTSEESAIADISGSDLGSGNECLALS